MDIPLPQGVHLVEEGLPAAPSDPRVEALLRETHAPTPVLLHRDRAMEAAGLRPQLLRSVVSRVHHAVLLVGRVRHPAVQVPAEVHSAAAGAVREVASVVADTLAAVAAVRVVASEAAGNCSELQCS